MAARTWAVVLITGPAGPQGRVPVNHVPDGYRIAEGHTPEVDEERAEVVRRISRHYVHDGMGAPAIVEALTVDGVPPARSGASWHATQINRILRNEAYRGSRRRSSRRLRCFSATMSTCPLP